MVRLRFFLAILGALAISRPAHAEERPERPECPSAWVAATELAAGTALSTFGVVSFDAPYTGRNPTMPALSLGAGFGAVLSGLALADARHRCRAGQVTGPSFKLLQSRATWATAAMATLTAGLAGAATLTHEPGVGMQPGLYEASALFMALGAAGTVVGVNLLLVPEVPARGTQTVGRLRLTLAPTPSGASLGMRLSF